MTGVQDCMKRQSGRIFRLLPSLSAGMASLATLVALLLWLGMWIPASAQDAPLALDRVNSEDEIVYIDAAGYLRVYDPQQPSNTPAVDFRSPDAGWFDATVGDVNGDGDDEIIAIAESGLLKVYDPVIAAGLVPSGQAINGIYWEELYATSLPGHPLLVATGHFDGVSAAVEIVVVYADPNNMTSSLVQIYFQPQEPFDGRTWRLLSNVAAAEQWSDIATGNLDGAGVDELALVNEERGALSVYRLEANHILHPFFALESETKPWSDVAIGNVDQGLAQPELVAVRNAPLPLPALVVQRYVSPDTFEDVGTRNLMPAPRVVFLADVNGSGDEEIFALRNVPSNATQPRLFVTNLGGDASFVFEAPLDTDNGYRYGAAGDIDGDGKDELALVRDRGLMIFDAPEANTAFRTQSMATNARTIALGNLDALGKDWLAASRMRFDLSLAAGKKIGAQLQLTNLTRPSNPIGFDVRLLPNVSFLWLDQNSGVTPATIGLTVDATELLPGIYGTNLAVTALDPLVANSPLTIPVIVEVLAGVAVRPSAIAIAARVDPATEGCHGVLETQRTLEVLGTAGSTYTVTVAAGSQAGVAETAPAVSADWLTVEPVSLTVPSVIRLVFDTHQLDAPGAYSAVVAIDALVADPSQTPISLRVPVNVLCIREALYLPTLRR